MRGKLNILVLAVMVVVLAMFGTSGFLLFQGIAKFSASEKKARKLLREITRYYEKSNPFPVPPNVERKQENAEKLETWYSQLTDELRKGEVGAVEGSPSKFMSLLTKTRNVLVAKAKKSDIKLAGSDEFAFGFGEYLAEKSNLPDKPAVPDLSRDLVVIYEISKALMEAKATSIEDIRRGDPPAKRKRPKPGSRPRPKPGKPKPGELTDTEKPEKLSLYTKRKFTFVFTCRERALLQVLNAVSKHKMYMEISSVELKRTAPDVVEPAKVEKLSSEETAAGVSAAPTASLLTGPQARPDARIVSGPGVETPMRVSLEIHVYRFGREATDEKS
jgi:hypothetical protein